MRDRHVVFLSSNAQDFIEEQRRVEPISSGGGFLSSNAQDFIEERACTRLEIPQKQFLSSNAQDFIEDSQNRRDRYDVSINS